MATEKAPISRKEAKIQAYLEAAAAVDAHSWDFGSKDDERADTYHLYSATLTQQIAPFVGG